MSDLRDQFDCSPRQYHAGLDILWEAIEGHDLDGETAYHQCAARIASLEAEVERLRVASHELMVEELMVERDGARLLIGGILEEARAIEANCREDWLEEGQGKIEKAAAAADLDFAIVYRERLEGMVRNTKHPEYGLKKKEEDNE